MYYLIQMYLKKFLKIGNILRTGPLFVKYRPHLRKLLFNGKRWISAEIAALQSGAVGTAGNTTGSVPIGTAESGIQRNFTDLLAVPATQLAAPGAIALMMVVKRVFHDYPSHKPMRLISQAGI